VDVNTPPAVVNVVEKRHFRSLTNSNILVLTALSFRSGGDNDYYLSKCQREIWPVVLMSIQ